MLREWVQQWTALVLPTNYLSWKPHRLPIQVTKMHRRTMIELGYDKETIEKAIPKNEPIKLIAEALYKAW